uniref:hypothetical protein n=1 Tax=Parasutterella excrementihominis TaxID=487175 RepID=UPI00242E4745
ASGFLQSEPRGSGLASGYVLGATACTSGLPPCRVRSCRAHKKIASTQFGTVFETIASVQKEKKFNGSIGLIMSSCLMGSNKELISQGIRQARLQWFFGYNCASLWMESTLIDTFLLYFLTKKGIHVQPTQDYLIKCFRDALALFDKNYLIGSDDALEKSIKEGLTLMISDGDFRRKPIDASSLLFL